MRLKHSGFSLIELMVAVLIVLIVLAGVVQVAFNSKRSYLHNQDTSYIQDNTRYAVGIMGQDIHMAGYKGCASQTPIIANVLDIGDAENKAFAGIDAVRGFSGVEGFENGAPAVVDAAKRVAGTDAIILRYGVGGREVAITGHDGSSFTGDFKNSKGDKIFDAGQPLLVVDANCLNAAVFGASSASVTAVGNATGTYNCNSSLKGQFTCDGGSPGSGAMKYSPGSVLMPFSMVGYYIGTSVADSTLPALKRVAWSGLGSAPVTDELAVGVSGLQLTYGVATAAGQITQFVDANTVADWGTVTAVRISLTFVGRAEKDISQKVTSTVLIRNRA